MSAPVWDDNVSTMHDSVLPVRLDDRDIADLERAGYTLEEYHELFAEALYQKRDDPNNELIPQERGAMRLEFWDLLEAIGYDREDFDWAEWRRWMGYE